MTRFYFYDLANTPVKLRQPSRFPAKMALVHTRTDTRSFLSIENISYSLRIKDRIRCDEFITTTTFSKLNV